MAAARIEDGPLEHGPAEQHTVPRADLRQRRVAFTGRLAALTRPEARDLVLAHGGLFSPRVTRQTDLLVIGSEGWPLRQDGQLTRKLLRARALQQQGAALEVLREDELFERLGLRELRQHVCGMYPLADVARLLSLPRDRLRAWVRHGLLRPVRTVHRLAYFDFRQVAGARVLVELTEAGVPLDRIRDSLTALRAWSTEEDPLLQLQVWERRRLTARTPDGQAVEPHGQLLFDFEISDPVTQLPFRPLETEPTFELASDLEARGELEAAANAYRACLMAQGPDAAVCFNLGNTLCGLGRQEAAVERWRQAVELDPEYVEAWNNLGNGLAETGRLSEAAEALQRAADLAPDFLDARYNLADVLTQLGRFDEARVHWDAYARSDPHSEWGRFARSQLARREPR